ncbi:heme o synthase [Flavobacteriaceae bacterium]|nr:heme o synthase [Flavobacteriaceae bacterium]MDA8850632.1 heme o synthase [Flavobacteriaceae bacterium]
MKTHLDSSPVKSISIATFVNDFLQLTKFRLALSVVFSSVAGYLLAVDQVETKILIGLFIGGFAMVGASNAINQLIEKDLDALMSRTKNRPLPTGRMSTLVAAIIATFLTVLGVMVLYAINLKTALFGLLSIFIYTCIYTPLKTISPLAVFVGAFPGAIPFMLGWVAATGKFGIEPGTLFMVQFFWQFPHFWAIGWMLDDDYKKAGFKMLPSGNPDRLTAFQIVFYTLWTIVISLLPATSYTGNLHLSIPGAILILIIGLYLLYYAIKLMQLKTKDSAKKLMFASIGYITILQLIYVIDKFI